MSTDLYIYYRVRADDAARFVPKVMAMQKELQRSYGVGTDLKRRPLAQDGLHTWMEIYLATPDGFEQQIDAAVAAHDLGADIEGKRHVEQFVDAASCA